MINLLNTYKVLTQINKKKTIQREKTRKENGKLFNQATYKRVNSNGQ